VFIETVPTTGSGRMTRRDQLRASLSSDAGPTGSETARDPSPATDCQRLVDLVREQLRWQSVSFARLPVQIGLRAPCLTSPE